MAAIGLGQSKSFGHNDGDVDEKKVCLFLFCFGCAVWRGGSLDLVDFWLICALCRHVRAKMK